MTGYLSKHLYVPLIILSLSLVVTAAAWYFSSREVNDHAAQLFDAETQQIESRINNRMMVYEQVPTSAVSRSHAVSSSLISGQTFLLS